MREELRLLNWPKTPSRMNTTAIPKYPHTTNRRGQYVLEVVVLKWRRKLQRQSTPVEWSGDSHISNGKIPHRNEEVEKLDLEVVI